MTDSVPEADGLNSAERTVTPEPLQGGKPKSIRKRGFHRAVKRGEMWAVMEFLSRRQMEALIHLMYGDSLPGEMSGLSQIVSHEKKE